MSAIDVRNISPGDVQVRVTLTYNHGQGSYRAPLVALRGSESRMVNVKELVRASQQTSAEGAIPAEVTFGGAVIEAIAGESDAPLVVASTVFDPVRGTCGAIPSCSTQDATVLLDGFAIPTCDSLCPITSPCADCTVFATVTISGNQSIKDGETAQFSVTVEGATATAYDWSFTAPSAAGNNPNVTFTPANAASTTTNGHWFASPNSECSASHDAVYTIRCTVTLDNGKTKTVQASLTVNIIWNPAGITFNPLISGSAEGAFDPVRQVWFVKGPGTLTRTLLDPEINVPASATELHAKTVAHEAKHVEQWKTGIWSDIYTISSLMEALSPLTDLTEAGLKQKVLEVAMNWRMQQIAIFNTRQAAGESEAFAISDPMAPQFIYQKACQGGPLK